MREESSVGASTRRAPGWGPSRTPRTATGGPLRSGPRRLYPHPGARLAHPGAGAGIAPERNRTDLKTITP